MAFRLKIQSFSDIITNSSTEIFTLYTRSDFNLLKDIVNSLLKVAGSDKTFDDLFELKIYTSKDAEIDYADGNPDEDFIDWCFKHDIDAYNNQKYYDGERFYIEGYFIKAKTEEAQSIAQKLSNLNNLFENFSARL